MADGLPAESKILALVCCPSVAVWVSCQRSQVWAHAGSSNCERSTVRECGRYSAHDLRARIRAVTEAAAGDASCLCDSDDIARGEESVRVARLSFAERLSGSLRAALEGTELRCDPQVHFLLAI